MIILLEIFLLCLHIKVDMISINQFSQVPGFM